MKIRNFYRHKYSKTNKRQGFIMEISRNKLTARGHVAAVAVQQTTISSENTLHLKANFASLGTKQIIIFNIL